MGDFFFCQSVSQLFPFLWVSACQQVRQICRTTDSRSPSLRWTHQYFHTVRKKVKLHFYRPLKNPAGTLYFFYLYLLYCCVLLRISRNMCVTILVCVCVYMIICTCRVEALRGKLLLHSLNNNTNKKATEVKLLNCSQENKAANWHEQIGTFPNVFNREKH